VTAWQALETTIAQTSSSTEQVRANEVALEGVRREQEVGARTILDILDAEQEALNSRVNLVASRTNDVVASYRVLAAVGALTAANLGLDVDYYDPAKHYHAVRNKFIGTGPSVE
jgi:outer membrane protein TolC